MTSVLLFFFSGTGSTWWVCNTLASKLRDNNIETNVRNIESTGYDEIEDHDIIGIGYPVYGSDCPVNVREFIENLPETKKDCFIVTSMLAFSGDGALTTEKILKEKGYSLRQAVNIKALNNIRLPYPGIAQFPIYAEIEAEKILESASKKIERLAEKISSGESWIEGRGMLGILGGLSQRIPVIYLGWTRWARNFSVDKEACIDCMQCVENCPVGNISMENGEIAWGEKCICCVRCYNLCPTDAILYKEASSNREKFPRFKGPAPGFKVSDMTE